MADLQWGEVKCFFDPELMGALPDVYVPGTSEEDWQRVLDLIEARGWQWEFRQGEMTLPLPSAAEVLFRPLDAELVELKVWPVPGVLAIFRLMAAEEIDFDIDLRELQGQAGVDTLCGFLTDIGRELGKPVLMTPEGGSQAHPVLGFDPAHDRVVLLADYLAGVDVQVLEGALVEVPADTGMDRRAFGEFVGPRGELASYAFGWTTGSDPHAARLSVGIGAGNPGGGTFHAVIFHHEDGHAFSLTSDPFERVPEGGPDLTADEARAHEDLPFIWAVADEVMRRDRRAWWMRHWLLRTMCVQTLEVFERREPILLVQHDADDGMWQLVGASDADAGTGKAGHLHHAIDEDRTLVDVLDLPPGGSVTRTGAGSPWTGGA